MATIVSPNVSTYGNSFTNVASQNIGDHETPGEIDVDNLKVE